VPKEHQAVLVYNRVHDEIVTAFKSGCFWQYTGMANSFNYTYSTEFQQDDPEITHWMPLPEKPYSEQSVQPTSESVA
jgi:hypothetical protein